MATTGAPTCSASSLPLIQLSPSSPINSQRLPAFTCLVNRKRWDSKRQLKLRASNSTASDSSPGLYSAKQFELTPKNVDLVLDGVRPYLISDGGNVDVVSVEDGVVSLKLQGLRLYLSLPSFLCCLIHAIEVLDCSII